MQYRTLGSTGALVSELALGTMTFGAETEEDEAHRIMDRYADAGGNLVDTADVYQHGASEEFVGRWLAASGRRDDVLVATKANFAMGEGPNERGLSRAWLTRAVDASLRRLGIDTIDLYQAHCWDPLTPIEETLQTFADLVAAGKIRYVGVSNFTGWQLQRAVLLARWNGWPSVVTLQPQYNLLERGIEPELVDLCVDEGVGLLPWSPLGGGWLTGKYRRDQPPVGATRLGEQPTRGVEAYDRRNTPRTWAIVDEVAKVADEIGATMGQVAIRWVTDRPSVDSTILGVRTVAQLDDNLGALDVELPDDARDRLDEVSAPDVGYPYDFIAEMTASRRSD